MATTGNDRSDGSANAPWQTLRYALSQLQAGDTLYLRGGTYTGSENTVDSQSGVVRSGTGWNNPIRIAGFSSEAVTIKPPDGQSGIRLTSSAPAYLIFEDIAIDMSNQSAGGGTAATGVYLGNGAHHNRFLRVEVKNNSGNGLSFSDANGNSTFNEVINCSIHDNGRVPGVNQGYGAYVSSSDNLFEGNQVYNNNGYGLHFYKNDGPLNVARNVIRRNRIYGNGGGAGTNYGIVVAWGDANRIEENEIYDNRGGILVYTNSANATVAGNNIYGNAPFEGILVQYATGTIVQNNSLSGSPLIDLGVNSTVSGNH